MIMLIVIIIALWRACSVSGDHYPTNDKSDTPAFEQDAEQAADTAQQAAAAAPAVPSIASRPVASSTTATATISDEECLKDIQCPTDRFMPNALVLCKPLVEAKARYEVKWTDGWLTPMFSRRAWADDAHDAIIYVGDKVEFQNGFHAFSTMSYFCTLDLHSLKVTNVEVQEGSLPTQ
ncbi:hypothetical protein [Rhodanobacter sp. B04]|uniref:hypothetical protein n=1 Tax=Rhodanobacter sp. B04 TaxID=1945860 RepID=UPI0020C2C07D|nr:hypothetical protein [Rhodanobacter sp. B04]